MSQVLTKENYTELAELGKYIVVSLECDVNENGVPCPTDRRWAIEFMRRYLVVNGYDVTENEESNE